MASKSVRRFKQGARMWQTDGRQTDYATENKWILRIGENHLRCKSDSA